VNNDETRRRNVKQRYNILSLWIKIEKDEKKSHYLHYTIK